MKNLHISNLIEKRKPLTFPFNIIEPQSINIILNRKIINNNKAYYFNILNKENSFICEVISLNREFIEELNILI